MHDNDTRPSEVRLPRRDFIVLPLISLLTTIALFVTFEIGSRIGWPEEEADACVISDPVLGHRFKPNCESQVKAAEGPWVTNRYNACGYRTEEPCGPPDSGTLRVDLMGSSFAQGYMVPYDGTIGRTLERSLGKQCRQKVQVENMSMVGYQGEIIYAQLDEALSLKPDAIVFLITVLDFDQDEGDLAQTTRSAPHTLELLRRVRTWVSQSHAIQTAQHFMVMDADRYAGFYLNYGDRANFLRPPFSSTWHRRLAHFDDLLRRMEAKVSAAHVPLVLVYVPSRAQAALLAMSHRPMGVDPYAFSRAIGKIAAADNVTYVDLSDRFSHLPAAGNLFYPEDGHLSAKGGPIVGQDVAARLAAEVPAFQNCSE